MSYMYPYGDTSQLNLDWILSKIKELEESSGSGGAAIEDILPYLETDTYSTSASYAVNDYVIYNKKIYRCTAATTGAWDSSKWTEVTVYSDIKLLGANTTAALNARVSNVSYSGGSTSTNGYLMQTKSGVSTNAMTVDMEPTENSNNPVKSGAVYDELTDLKDSISAIGVITGYTTESGYINMSGNVNQAENSQKEVYTTTKIPVQYRDTICFELTNASSVAHWVAMAVYDSNNTFLSRPSYLSTTDVYSGSFTVTDQSAAYIILSWRTYGTVKASFWKGATLQELKDSIDNLGSDDIANDSTVSGQKVSGALETLQGVINDLIEVRTKTNVEITDSSNGFIDSGISTQDYIMLNAYAFLNANNAFHISNLVNGNYRLQLFNCVTQNIVTTGTVSQINMIVVSRNKVKAITVN